MGKIDDAKRKASEKFGRIFGNKSSKGQRKKFTLKQKLLLMSACSLLLVVSIFALSLSILNSNYKNILSAILGQSIAEEELPEDEKAVYTVDTGIGVDSCIARPKTGIYPGSTSASGVTASRGELPVGIPTIQEMIDFEIQMYEHTKVKYAEISDKIGDHNSDGTGFGHVFSMYNASHWWKHVHNNNTYGYKGFGTGRDGGKLVVDTDYSYSYGTFDLNDNRTVVSDSGNGKPREMGANKKSGYESLGGALRTYSNYTSSIHKANSSTSAEPTHQVKAWWQNHGSKSSNKKAIYECDDGVSRYGIVVKATMGRYIYGEEFEAGDYLDVYYADGTIDHCVMQDSKGMESESFVMHNDGSIIEQYIVGSCPGNLLKDCMSDRYGIAISGFVKTGNLFDDPKGEKTYTPTWVNGHPGEGEATKTDTPSDTSDTSSGATGGSTGVSAGASAGTTTGEVEYVDANGVQCTPEGTTGAISQTEPVTGKRTFTNLLLVAKQPLGKTLYCQWPGGLWDDTAASKGDARAFGVKPEWEQLFNWYSEHDKAWVWKNKDIPSELVKGGSRTNYANNVYNLDCSRYVGWTWLNTMYSPDSGGDSTWLASVALEIHKNYYKGEGQFQLVGQVGHVCSAGAQAIDKNAQVIDIQALQPGDVLTSGSSWGHSHPGHVVMSLGVTRSGTGVVIVHCSPTGVKLGGVGGDAGELAEEYMRKYYPAYHLPGDGFNFTTNSVTLGKNYLNGYVAMRTNSFYQV